MSIGDRLDREPDPQEAAGRIRRDRERRSDGEERERARAFDGFDGARERTGVEQAKRVLERLDVAGEDLPRHRRRVARVLGTDVGVEDERRLRQVAREGKLQRLVALATDGLAEAHDGAFGHLRKRGEIGDGQVYHLLWLLHDDVRHAPFGRVERVLDDADPTENAVNEARRGDRPGGSGRALDGPSGSGHSQLRIWHRAFA